MGYKFPPSLELLDCYLRQRGEDVDAIRSDRHALHLLITTTKIRVQFPPKGQPCYCALRRLHTLLFVGVPLKKRPSRPRRVHGIGLTGPASDCRTVFSKETETNPSHATGERPRG